jgi:hypothetical protein
MGQKDLCCPDKNGSGHISMKIETKDEGNNTVVIQAQQEAIVAKQYSYFSYI